ncbi:hypothetical protein C8Q74DRAFT_967685 [Fomes fomentarius]|nr:hypothetical protein C8Q74DRAFT_967685 [Fomes fomentarius]
MCELVEAVDSEEPTKRSYMSPSYSIVLPLFRPTPPKPVPSLRLAQVFRGMTGTCHVTRHLDPRRFKRQGTGSRALVFTTRIAISIGISLPPLLWMQ